MNFDSAPVAHLLPELPPVQLTSGRPLNCLARLTNSPQSVTSKGNPPSWAVCCWTIVRSRRRRLCLCC